MKCLCHHVFRLLINLLKIQYRVCHVSIANALLSSCEDATEGLQVSRLRCLQMLRSAFSTWGVSTRAINSAREAAMRHGHQRRQRVLRDVFRCWCALCRTCVFGFFMIMTTMIDIKRLSGLELVLKAR